MKNSPYYIATAGIRTSDLQHSMTTNKKVPCSYPLGHTQMKVADIWNNKWMLIGASAQVNVPEMILQIGGPLSDCVISNFVLYWSP